MDREVRIITDRVLLLGLDEGYYHQSPDLTEYFQLLRALQQQPRALRDRLATSRELARLDDVTSARIFGTTDPSVDSLPPQSRDPLYFALESLDPATPAHERVVERARELARADGEELSLVGLASFSGDPVLIAAFRETVVQYAAVALLGLEPEPPPVVYRWAVDDELGGRVRCFVESFNALFSEALPGPDPSSSEEYWRAYENNEVHGRCVRIGIDPRRAAPNYHWGLYRDRSGECQVEEFWSERLWTTSYHSGHRHFAVHGPKESREQ